VQGRLMDVMPQEQVSKAAWKGRKPCYDANMRPFALLVGSNSRPAAYREMSHGVPYGVGDLPLAGAMWRSCASCGVGSRAPARRSG
jgi:hypothetical protein